MVNGNDIVKDFIASDISSEILEAENAILEPLEQELNLITNSEIRSFTRALLLKVKNFWYAVSNDEPSFYPPDEAFPGGLVLHTKRVFRVCEILAAIYELPPIEQDKLRAAAILHDITKFVDSSEDKHYAYDYLHPYTVDSLYRFTAGEDRLNSDAMQSNVLSLSDDHIQDILKMVRSHKGITSPIPETVPAKASVPMLLCTANEVAKSLHYIIDGESIILERWLKNDGEQE